MISFEGLNKDAFLYHFEKTSSAEKKRDRWHFCCGFALFLVLFILIVVATNTASNTLMMVTIGYLIFLIVFTIIYLICHFKHIGFSDERAAFYSIRAHIDDPYEVIVSNDACYTVMIDYSQVARIIQVDALQIQQTTHAIVLQGIIETPRDICHEFSIPLVLNYSEELISLLYFSIQQKEANQFCNDVLKKDMHMSEEQRKQHFLPDLSKSRFLLPCTLNKDIGLPIQTEQNVVVHIATLQNTIPVFTSQQEIGDNLMMYPLRIVISLQDLIYQCCESKENPALFKNVTIMKINPYSEGIQLEMTRIWKWLTKKQEETI